MVELSQVSFRIELNMAAINLSAKDRGLFLCIFTHEIRSSGVRASITIVHIRKFYKT